MKMAPTPMGPNQPTKIASRKVLMSGMNLYVAMMAGRRRTRRMRMAKTTRRQTCI